MHEKWAMIRVFTGFQYWLGYIYNLYTNTNQLKGPSAKWLYHDFYVAPHILGLRSCSFRCLMNPIHYFPNPPTHSPFFSHLNKNTTPSHSHLLFPPPFPYSFIQLPSLFNSFQLLLTLIHSSPSSHSLKKYQSHQLSHTPSPPFPHSPTPHSSLPTEKNMA